MTFSEHDFFQITFHCSNYFLKYTHVNHIFILFAQHSYQAWSHLAKYYQIWQPKISINK